MKHVLASLALAALSGVSATAPTSAQEAEDFAQVDILPGWRMDNGHHMAALRITLRDGWHTYWRAPGDAGIPPRFDWDGSRNLAGVGLHWPVPQVFEQNGMRSIGYENELILPIEIEPTASGDIRLSGEVEYGVCLDICMPMTSQFEIDLPADAHEQDPTIAAVLDSRPKTVGGATCIADPIRDGMRISASLETRGIGGELVAVIEHPDAAVWVSEAVVERKGSQLTATSDMVPPDAAPFMVNRSALTITVIGDGEALEARGCTAG